MPDLIPLGSSARRRSNWVRLRTIVVLRWIAVSGQLGAITVAQRFYNIELNLELCLLAIGAAIIANLFAIFVYPENKRLSETEVALMLMFDLTQLCFLLFLTGGLNNPFALLVLAPVTISATALRPRTSMLIAAVAIAFVSALTVVHVPLTRATGEVLRLSPDFLLGFYAAIVIGIVFLSAFAYRVTTELHAMSDALAATQMALAREQKLTDLGGVVAAAAHELGTPLATIKLVSAELQDELADRPGLLEDARLINAEADRCRDILGSMGRAGKEDRLLRHAPLGTVVQEAAGPHAERGKTLVYDIGPTGDGGARQPVIERRPEIIHGLRNLIQNAVDFARETVWIDVIWSADAIVVRIVDDGPGFSLQVLGRIGDPFVRLRRDRGDPNLRPEYEGMGLGLFIAKTLLERSGAEITFANGRDPYDPPASTNERAGAVVECRWPRPALVLDDAQARQSLGPNQPIRT